ncbi:MAG: NADH:flavin oxidoreductase, partial [Rhodospirillaceae bacterium]|nr:NADH:flavin oxidoreductase [Rhodospirillaceae bacterium]
MAQYDALFEPLRIKDLVIRNRFLSTSHQPAYNEGGRPSERYIRYQIEKAKGGVGMAQCGGATCVAPENSFYYGQLDATTDAIIPHLRDLSERLHEQGAVCTIQLAHGGRRERWDLANWIAAVAPSPVREPVHKSFPREMEDWDIERVIHAFARAAWRCREGGFDGVEVSCQAGTLIQGFWSPDTNRRTDEYGGDLDDRMRFGLDVFRAVREAVGGDYVVGMRMPGDELIKEGLSPDDCRRIAATYAGSGLIDFVSVVGGIGKDHLNSAKLWPSLWLPNAAYLHLSSGIKAEIDIPVFHATRITDPVTAARAVEEGHLDMVGMTRAFIADPHFARKLREGREDDIRLCTGASYCLDTVLSGIGTKCIQNAATGREAVMPQIVPRAEGAKRRVVVAGAGPAGLEAARVSAERGHEVVLFERAGRVGGQVHYATKLGWRESIAGVHQWLEKQVRKQGVDIRLGTEATAEAVLAENPDIVVVATGGVPDLDWIDGWEHCVSTWDVLSGAVAVGADVLVYDGTGQHAAVSCAEELAAKGRQVRLVTPDTTLAMDLPYGDRVIFQKRFYEKEIPVIVDLQLT